MTIYIAERGTPLVTGDTSAAGHMWFSISKNGTTEQSFGFGSATHGMPGGVGKVFDNDVDNYTSYAYAKSIFITGAQYDALKSFGENPASRGFDASEYNWAVNSCVDFTYLVAKRIDAGDKRLTAVEWKGGTNVRIVELVAPFGGEAVMREQLSDVRAQRLVKPEMKSLFEGSMKNRTGMEPYVCTA
jgi:hypothetical protein